MIIKWTQNVPFNVTCDFIITFLTNVLGVDDNDDDDEPTLGPLNNCLMPLFLPQNIRKRHSNDN